MRGCLAFLLLAGPFITAARGDVGLVRLSEQVGPYRLTVFTSPTPFRAGPVEIGVIVQDPATDRPVADAAVTIKLALRDSPQDENEYALTTSSSQLVPSANFELSNGGWWQVRVMVKGSLGDAEKTLLIEADEPLPRWREMMFWIALPLAPIGLYIVHQWLVRRREHA